MLAVVVPRDDRRCIGLLFSIRCRTWSAATWLPDPQGRPGKPWRDCDHLLGIPRAGKIPDVVVESNLESEHTASIALAVAKGHGFVLGETPARRAGAKAYPHHRLDDCTRSVHMFDHPAWVAFTEATGAVERIWDQCMKSSSPSLSPIKSSMTRAIPAFTSVL